MCIYCCVSPFILEANKHRGTVWMCHQQVLILFIPPQPTLGGPFCLSNLRDTHSWKVLLEKSVVWEAAHAILQQQYWFLMLPHLHWRFIDNGKRGWKATKWLQRSRNYISHIMCTVESKIWNTVIWKLYIKLWNARQNGRERTKQILKLRLSALPTVGWISLMKDSFMYDMTMRQHLQICSIL